MRTYSFPYRKFIENLNCVSWFNSEILNNPSKTGRVNSVMSEYLTVDPKNLTVDPAWLAGVNSVNFGVNSEIYKNHTIDPSYSGRVNSEINCCNTFDGPDGI